MRMDRDSTAVVCELPDRKDTQHLRYAVIWMCMEKISHLDIFRTVIGAEAAEHWGKAKMSELDTLLSMCNMSNTITGSTGEQVASETVLLLCPKGLGINMLQTSSTSNSHGEINFSKAMTAALLWLTARQIKLLIIHTEAYLTFKWYFIQFNHLFSVLGERGQDRQPKTGRRGGYE